MKKQKNPKKIWEKRTKFWENHQEEKKSSFKALTLRAKNVFWVT